MNVSITTSAQCATLSVPSGGGIQYSSDGATTTANFSCTAGFNLVGDGLLTCQSDQSWDPTVPVCVQCATLQDPFGGQVTLATNGYVTTASYSCPTGYYLVGTDTRTCSSAGIWDSSDPTCRCSDPATPTNGAMTTNGTLTSYTCDVSFTLIGPSTRVCQSDGSVWSGDDPVCSQCSTLANSAGAAYQISSTGYVTSASFTCALGYTLAGNSVITCQADGSWETPPTCASCSTLPGVASGNITFATDGYMTTATYACAPAYGMTGAPVRNCTTSGSWTASAPTCSCQSPATPQNGSVTADGYTATYTCHMGFSLSGAATRTCADDGSSWSGSDPTCSECASLANPDGGTVSRSTDGLQTVAFFMCSTGYTMSGGASISCGSNGTWTTAVPTCVLCPTLSDPSSGSVSMATDGYTSTASYSCTSGYYISGAQSVTCSTDGRWSVGSPTCKCNIPSTPANGTVAVSDGAKGPEATYSCTLGFSLNGARTRTCQDNGQGWDATDPTCVPCTTLTYPPGGSLKFTSDGLQTSAIATCSVGYTLNGAQNVTCGSDGTWDTRAPTCVNCASLADPSSGTVTLTTNNYVTTASFSCVSGYYVSGTLSVTCGVDGQWSGSTPICKCNIPTAPANGSVSVSDGRQGPEAYYTCQQGFSLAGSATRLCQTNGQGWDSTDPVCSLCTALTVQGGLSKAVHSNGTTTSVTFSCPVNYTLDGAASTTCGATGAWDNPIPTCVACSAVQPPASGGVTFSTDGQVTMATFTCVFGYSLNASAVITCQTDGAWDLPEPACVCDPPSAVTNGAIMLSSNGRIANYSCATGYQLVGSARRHCMNNGTGWNGTAPRCDAESLPDTGASTEDKEVLSLPLAVFIVMLCVIAALAIALGLFIYFRGRGDRSKISATFESGDSSQQTGDRTSDLNSPKAVESGTAALIGRHSDKDHVFNVRRQRTNGTMKSDKKPHTNGTLNGDAKPLKSSGSISEELPETTTISMPNGTAQHIPIQSVRLPKLPPRPPANDNEPKNKPPTKRKRKPKAPKPVLAESKPDPPKPKPALAQPRTSTPLETQIARMKTPDVLSAAEFGYITPQYCYEVDTPMDLTPMPSRPGTTRPPTSFSGNSTKTASGVNVDMDKSRSSSGSTKFNAKSCVF